MEYNMNGLPMFNGENGLDYEIWSKKMIFFFKKKDMIFGIQLLQDIMVQRNQIVKARRN